MCKALAQANGKDREKRQSREADGVLGRIIRGSMVHPGGFEPPTARFVAEYSIQLSYGCIGDTALLRVHVIIADVVEKYGASGRIRTSDRSVRSRVLYPAELRMHRDLLLYY